MARWRAEVRQAAPGRFKPFAQSLYIGLGVNHVILNLKYGTRPAAEVVEEIGLEVLPALAGAEVDGAGS